MVSGIRIFIMGYIVGLILIYRKSRRPKKTQPTQPTTPRRYGTKDLYREYMARNDKKTYRKEGDTRTKEQIQRVLDEQERDRKEEEDWRKEHI